MPPSALKGIASKCKGIAFK
ncbi:MAG TPA: hypothetical protein ENJ95_14210 [Bacteroidetes bacterium]|nr:hypothetical protein [Bacteroidota bacterium]